MKRGAWIVLVACAVSLVGGSKITQMSGEIVKISFQMPDERLHLKVSDTLYTLKVEEHPLMEILDTGVHVDVKGVVDEGESVIVVEALTIEGGASTVAKQKNGDRKRLSSITYALEMCGSESHDIEQLHTNLGHIDKYMNNCTYGLYSLLPKKNIVVGPIEMPCTHTCSANDAHGWAMYAQDYVTKMLRLDVSQYMHHMFMLSPNTSCSWAGLGTIGCTSKGCLTWYSGDYGYDMSIVLHELGHNFGLQHSGTSIDEYGDGSCIMGYARTGSYRCFNVPQSLDLGSSSAKYILNNIPDSKRIHFYLRAHTLSNASALVVRPWAYEGGGMYVISFRAPIGYDVHLEEKYQNKVFVHWKQPNGKSVLLESLSVFEHKEINNLGVTVCYEGLYDMHTAHVSMYKQRARCPEFLDKSEL